MLSFREQRPLLGKGVLDVRLLSNFCLLALIQRRIKMNMKLSTNRKFRRMFANILSIFVILTMAFPAMGSAYAQEPSPWLVAFPEWDFVEGYEWPMGTLVHLMIDDPATEDSPDMESDDTAELSPWAPWGDARTYVSYEFAGEYDLKPGDVVTLIDEFGTTRTHTVQNLAVTEVNGDTDTVSGTAYIGAVVQVWPHGTNYFIEDTAEDGTWVANFGDLGFHAIEETGGRSQIVIDGNATAVDWSVPPPPPSSWLRAHPKWESVDGWYWPLGAELHLTIEDPNTEKSPDLEMSKIVDVVTNPPENNTVWFDFAGTYDLKPGDLVTMTDSVTTHSLIVSTLSIDAADVEANIITGIAEPGAVIRLPVPGEVFTTANDDGQWKANFGEAGFDLVAGTTFIAELYDDDGDLTSFELYIPNPRFDVRANTDRVEGWEWTIGETVTLEVGGKTFTKTVDPAPWDPNQSLVEFDLTGEYDIQPGDVVTLSNKTEEMPATITKTTTVTALTITSINVETDIVSGVALPGSHIDLWVSTPPDWHNYYRHVTADEYGNWSANFSVVGTGDDEQETVDIVGDVWIDSQQPEFDDDGDKTMYGQTVPRFVVFPEWEWFDGLSWPDGAEVVITVEDKPECTVTKESWDGFFNGNFGEGCNVEIGDTVTFTDGVTPLTHTVQNLAITKVNYEDDMVKGVADAGTEIYVWPHATGQQQMVTANPKGKWNVGFTGIYDLMPGDGGRAEIRDDTGNATAVDWYIPKPRIVASITEDWFYMQEFAPNMTVNFTVYKARDKKPIWKGTATTDGSGFAWIDAEGRWNLEPGNYLVVKDGQNTKDLVIEGFTFDVFNLSNGQLSGTAPSGRNVWVGIGWQDQDAWTMNVTTDETTGSWIADFEKPVPGNYWWVAAQIFDDDGDASELRPTRILE